MADILEKYEKQFKVSEMRNKHLFYDLYAKVGDPEELRGYIVQLLKDMDWKVTLNELAKFEDLELEGIFRGGRLKPVKALIKAYNRIVKGPKHPILWKSFFVAGLISLGLYFATITYFSNINSNIFMILTPILLLISLGIYLIKEKIGMAMWIKVAGIYDASRESADLRVVIAGDVEKRDKQAFDKLDDDASEFYNSLISRYVKRIRRVNPEAEKPFGPKVEKILKSLVEVNKEIDKLEKRFVNGRISEDTYKSTKKDLLNKKQKLEMLAEMYEEE